MVNQLVPLERTITESPCVVRDTATASPVTEIAAPPAFVLVRVMTLPELAAEAAGKVTVVVVAELARIDSGFPVGESVAVVVVRKTDNARLSDTTKVLVPSLPIITASRGRFNTRVSDENGEMRVTVTLPMPESTFFTTMVLPEEAEFTVGRVSVMFAAAVASTTLFHAVIAPDAAMV